MESLASEAIGQQLQEVAEGVIAQAKALGASAVEVSCSANRGLSTTVRLGAVETLEFSNDRGVSINVYFGQRKGSATTADLDPESVSLSLQQACAIAKFTEEDSCGGLADAEDLATEHHDLDLWHPWQLQAEQAVELALETEQSARDNAQITNSDGAVVNSHAGVSVYATSHGFVGRQAGTRHGITCMMIAGEGSSMQRDYDYDVARCADDLRSGVDIGRSAAEKTARRLGARKLKTARLPVVYAPEVARGLLGHLVGAAKGGALYRKASFLLDKLDHAILPQGFSLRERPHLQRAIGSCNYDAEGVATRERDIVADGRLVSYVLSSYSARKLGLRTTGNAGGVHNVQLIGPTRPAADLVAGIEDGLLVTDVMGQGINMVTGDYSRGASGFRIRNGELAEPVHEITVAGNLLDMYRSIRGLGDDIDRRGNIACGSVLIEGMMIAGD